MKKICSLLLSTLYPPFVNRHYSDIKKGIQNGITLICKFIIGIQEKVCPIIFQVYKPLIFYEIDKYFSCLFFCYSVIIQWYFSPEA